MTVYLSVLTDKSSRHTRVDMLWRCVQGGVIMVSHDERLVRMICTELWLCKDGSVKCLPGGLDEYKDIVVHELEQLKAS